MRDGDVFLLVYSITSTLSIQEVKTMHDQLVRVNPKGALNALLVGNKHDLTEDRVVQTNEGKSLASEWSIPFLETSALKGTNVEKAFTTIPQRMMSAVPQRNIKPRRVCCMIV
jgi:GTPase SAR1 family protein